MSRSSSALAAPTPLEATSARERRTVALRDLDVAPENLRAGEGPDDEVPLLADTLFAAGQLQALTVRPGRKKEKAYQALDGRRRLLALRLLVEQGRIGADFPVEVVVETDPARQAAAAVLTNTAVPVHVADVIAAIGRMLKSRLTVPEIARALGHAEIDIRRLAALSALPAEALEALRLGRMNLRQARLLARLKDAEEQAGLAREALEGGGFPDWRVAERLDRGQVTAQDPRCALVTPEAYAEAGGRTETDLFGERPPVLLDAGVLNDLWTGRAARVAAVFEAEGLTVHVAAVGEPALPEDLETPGYIWGGSLPPADMEAWRAARDEHEAAAARAEAALGAADGGEVETALVDLVRRRLIMDQIALGGRVATTVVMTPAMRTGIEVRVWTPVELEPEPEPASAEAQGGSEPGEDSATTIFEPPMAQAPEPETEGVGHGLHALCTDVATRGLIRALADDPRTALTAVIARLFVEVARPGGRPAGDSALTVTGKAFDPRGGRVIAALDGVVRERVDARRAAWQASGLTVIGWVHGLEEQTRLALLAELAALTLDLREERTSRIRRTARAEACELADLSDARPGRWWTPDEAFLAAHPKARLVEMLVRMGKTPPTGKPLAKTELVALAEATAAARNWTPPALSWNAPAGEDGEAAEPREEKAVGVAQPEPADDGIGAFEVTPKGEAALAGAPV